MRSLALLMTWCEFPDRISPPKHPKTQTTRSRGLLVVVAQHSAQSLPPLNAAHALWPRPADEPVPDTLVAALVMIVLHELLDGSIERALANKDHLSETLRLDRPDEPLGVRVHVRSLVGCEQGLHARAGKD